MASVTQVIKHTKQPRGGYINLKDFESKKLIGNENENLSENENIHSSLIGMSVDYLSRFLNGADVENAFSISLKGAHCVGEFENAVQLINNIKSNDYKSIVSACKLVGYDVAFRAGVGSYKSVSQINPDDETITNIQIMLKRSIGFFEQYGPIIKDGFTFQGGYTNIINTGDGDFLTKDTLWDFKVSKYSPTSKHTLQLLIYYLMGLKSIHDEFDGIKNLGIFNPRLNIVYIYNLKNVSPSIIDIVNHEIIGYMKR